MTRRTVRLAALVALVVLAAPLPAARASDKAYKCRDDAQTCLNRMVAKLKTSGWLGIEYDESRGPKAFRITKVVPGSPAESAGFRAGDVLVSVNGAKFADNTEDRCVTCERTKGVFMPGSKMEYVVTRDGTQVKLAATLAPLPSDVMAMMIGMHMIEHAQPVAAGK
jgi:predicted metalloprotease with PDZ domain